MTRFMLLTAAAALAFSSAAGAAPQGKNNGKAKHSHSVKANKGGKHAAGGHARGRADVDQKRGKGNSKAMANKRKDDRKDFRLARNDRDDDRRSFVRVDRDDWRDRDNRRGAWANGGCPPGLSKMQGECMPWGQAKQFQGQSLRVLRSRLGDRVIFREMPARLRYVYRDTPNYYYRYANGYAYKVDRQGDLIRAVLPLFGLGAIVGQPFPTAYANSYMPTGLRSFYPNTPYTSHRYANGYVYQVNPATGLIQNVNPMLGYGYGFGQMMPATYSAYNLPYQYRTHYRDSNDHYYRYAPGSIYRVDAGSGLIDSVAALLMPGGMSVGQPLPMGYDAYNVPYQYRTQYYDTPQHMYRYANGNIYQVDPTTRLVTAIISALI